VACPALNNHVLCLGTPSDSHKSPDQPTSLSVSGCGTCGSSEQAFASDDGVAFVEDEDRAGPHPPLWRLTLFREKVLRQLVESLPADRDLTLHVHKDFLQELPPGPLRMVDQANSHCEF